MDTSNPFLQSPFQPQQPKSGSASTIKPFAAGDLGPQATTSGSAFLESPFLGRDSTPPPSADLQTPHPGFANGNAPHAAPEAYAAPAPKPQPIPMPMAAPAPMPAAASQSKIIAASELMNASSSGMKPRFFVTTTAGIDGFPVQEYLGVVSVEIVVPKDLLFTNPAPYGELHRIKAAEDQLQKVKEKAMEELAERARHMHADGVVGVTMQFSQMDTVVSLCSAVGTAVRLMP